MRSPLMVTDLIFRRGSPAGIFIFVPLHKVQGYFSSDSVGGCHGLPTYI
jgi:hypothetical protein